MLPVTHKIVLAGKSHHITELVFRQLRGICLCYAVLADAAVTEDDKAQALFLLLEHLTGQRIAPNRVKKHEWEALFNALPAICGFDAADKAKSRPADMQTQWGNVYAHLARCFGWSYDEIDSRMTLTRLKELSGYLQHNPTADQMMAAYFGLAHQQISAEESFFKTMAAQARLSANREH